MAQPAKGEHKTEYIAPMAYFVFLVMAYVLTGALLLLLAFLLYRFQFSRRVVAAGIVAIYVAATFFAGFLAGKRAKTRKYLFGFMMGAGYFLILAAMSFLMHSGEGSMGFVTSFLLCAGGGTLGGMVS